MKLKKFHIKHALSEVQQAMVIALASTTFAKGIEGN